MLSQLQFLYTFTRKHTVNTPNPPFSVSKSVLILLGPTKVLQTNVMDCSSPCIDLFCHAQMTEHNITVFLIKEGVINLMISSPCVPHNTLLVILLLVSLPFGFCVDVCVCVCVGRDTLAIRLSDEKCVITVLLKVHQQTIRAMSMFDWDPEAREDKRDLSNDTSRLLHRRYYLYSSGTTFCKGWTWNVGGVVIAPENCLGALLRWSKSKFRCRK